MSAMLIRNARVLTMLAPGESAPPIAGRRGKALGTLGVLPKADVLIENGQVVGVGEDLRVAVPRLRKLVPTSVHEIDAQGRVLMPGFVDCHTHACWAGSRVDEWERKLAGATYQEIMAAGGGIMSTVRAVREGGVDALQSKLVEHASRMLALGSTTIEVKSGYGLTQEHEMSMLTAIAWLQMSSKLPALVQTALLGHAIDPAASSAAVFVNQTIDDTLSAVHASFPGIAIDAFCEKGAWSLDDCVRLFEKARQLGHPIRVHADQFTSMGMIGEAIRLGALSVDHLEATTPDDLKRLAESETFGVMLPVCGFHLDGRYANGRGFLDGGGKLCIATNYNPGSAPCPSMPFAIALAVRHLNVTPAEAIGAATLNPAVLIGLTDRGYIAPGARADLILLQHTDERALAYEVGDNPVAEVWVAGNRLADAQDE